MAPHPPPMQPDPLRLHFTEVLLDPVTVAMNCCCAPVLTEAEAGDTDTLTVVAVMVAVVEPEIPGLVTDVAVTVTVAGVGGSAGAV